MFDFYNAQLRVSPFSALSDKTNVQIATALSELKEKYGCDKQNRYLFVKSSQFAAKIDKAIKAFAPIEPNERPILMKDTTLFGSAKEGFVMTEQCIYVKNTLSAPYTVIIDDITSVFCSVHSNNLGYIYITTNNGKFELTNESTKSDAEACTSFLSELIYGIQSHYVGMLPNVDDESITLLDKHFTADELDKALKICQSMSTATLEACREGICDAISDKLAYYRNSERWVCTNRAFVDPKVLEILKAYEKILDITGRDFLDDHSQAFLAAALKMEKYLEWNAYYSVACQNHSENIDNYLEQANAHISTSRGKAFMYYEKAYAEANNAYNGYRKCNGKGTKEAAKLFKLLSEQYKRMIADKPTTAAQKTELNRATAEYEVIKEEYNSALSELRTILEPFKE